jgi:hypothetical protein
MYSPIEPLVSFALLILGAAALGHYPIKKLIQVREAKHELKHGSAGFIRTTSGWIIIAVWLAATWFLATIIGDWWATGDLSGAILRSGRRLELILRILEAMGDD